MMIFELWSLHSGGYRYDCSTAVAKLFGVKENWEKLKADIV
jgi:hypothetical protein